MTPYARILLFSLALVVCAAPAAAQKRKSCPTPPPSPFKHSGQIVTAYDGAARGMRTTLTHPVAVGADPAHAVYLTASFVYAKRPAPPVAEIAFVSADGLQAGAGLSFTADGRDFPLGGAARFQNVRGAGGATFRAARIALSYNSLMNLLRAKRVSARLGGAAYELKHNHLEALRELASQMAPPPSAWDAVQQTASR